MDVSIIDTIFVISLSFLALSMIIFLIFFVPVLVELTKVLQATRTLVDLAKDYVGGIHEKLHGASDGLGKAAAYVSALARTIGEAAVDLVFSSKRK